MQELSESEKRRRLAWDRLLKQMELRQRYVNQTAATERRAAVSEQRQNDKMAPQYAGNTAASFGGQIGGPWGYLVGGVLGHTAGAYDYANKRDPSTGKKYGYGKAFVNMLNPVDKIKSLTSPQGAGTTASNVSAYNQEKARRETAQKDDERWKQLLRARFGNDGAGTATQTPTSDSGQSGMYQARSIDTSGGNYDPNSSLDIPQQDYMNELKKRQSYRGTLGDYTLQG